MTDDEFEIAAAVMDGEDDYWGQKLVAEVRRLRGQLEDEYDLRYAAEARAEGGEPIPAEEVHRSL